MDPQDRRVKIHREEMESLLNLKSRLDHEEAVSSYAAKYQKLGWVLQALAASYPSIESYYQGILTAAAAVGLNAPEVLLSVLWHAPRGNARQYPEGLGVLEKLVAAAQVQAGPATCPKNVPWKLSLDNTRSQARESSAGSPGPARFLGRSRAQPPQPGGLFGPPFPVARAGKINGKSNASRPL